MPLDLTKMTTVNNGITTNEFFTSTTITDDIAGSNCSQNCTIQPEDDDGISLDADFHMQIIYLLIGIFGMTGNALVAGVLLHFKSMRTNLTNTFIINQSVIDGTASFFIVLSTFIRDVSGIKDPLAQELFCRLWLTNLPIWGIFVSSTYNMVAVTFERYSALVQPLTHQHHFTRKKALVIITVIWISGPAYNAAYMIPTAGMVDGECTVYSIWPNVLTQTAVGLLTVALQYFIPLVLITYAYTHIAIVLSRAGVKKDETKSSASINRDERISRARKNVIKTLALVSACFVFCWSWNQIYYTMYNCGFDADFNSSFYHFTVIMVFCNCCLNPVVYAVKYEQFQKGFCLIFGCHHREQSADKNSTGLSKVSDDEKSENQENANQNKIGSKSDLNQQTANATAIFSISDYKSGNHDPKEEMIKRHGEMLQRLASDADDDVSTEDPAQQMEDKDIKLVLDLHHKDTCENDDIFFHTYL